MMNESRSGLFVILLLLLCHAGCDRRSTTGPAESAAETVTLVPLTNMGLIKAGSFLRQKHVVTLTRDFWLATNEVTQGEFQAVTGKNPSKFGDDPKRPVERLSYYQALAYCAEITRRE